MFARLYIVLLSAAAVLSAGADEYDDLRLKWRNIIVGSAYNVADPDVVSRVEDKVRAVELEFLKYAHDAEAEVTVRVRYEDGNAGTATRRLAWAEVPEAVRSDFDRRGGTRVFRAWVFPWARARAL